MTVTSGFFNSINKDRVYDAFHFADYFASFIGNGVFPNPSSGLQVTSNNDMTVDLNIGKAWIDGYFMKVEEIAETLSIDVGDSMLNRIDTVVARLDVLDRSITPHIVKGELASSPKPTKLRRDDLIYELCLAEITVRKGATKINQADIRDTRHIKDLCGIVATIVQDIDVSTLYIQYEKAMENLKDEFKENADSKLLEIIQILEDINKIIESENIAGELVANINKKQDKVIKDKLSPGEYELEVRNGRPYLRVVKV